MFVQLTEFNGFAVVDFATHKEITRIELPKLPPGKEPVHEGGNASHGMAVSADNTRLIVDSRLNSAVYVYSLPDLKLLGGDRRRHRARLGHADARRQDGLRRERGLERRVGRRHGRPARGHADSGRPGAEAQHHGDAAVGSVRVGQLSVRAPGRRYERSASSTLSSASLARRMTTAVASIARCASIISTNGSTTSTGSRATRRGRRDLDARLRGACGDSSESRQELSY